MQLANWIHRKIHSSRGGAVIYKNVLYQLLLPEKEASKLKRE